MAWIFSKHVPSTPVEMSKAVIFVNKHVKVGVFCKGESRKEISCSVVCCSDTHFVGVHGHDHENGLVVVLCP